MAQTERVEWNAFSDAMALLGAGTCIVIGLTFAVAGKDPVIAFHGSILLVAACVAGVFIFDDLRSSKIEVEAERQGYADGVIRAGVIATVFWGVAGFLVGDIIAWQLAYP